MACALAACWPRVPGHDTENSKEGPVLVCGLESAARRAHQACRAWRASSVRVTTAAVMQALNARCLHVPAGPGGSLRDAVRWRAASTSGSSSMVALTLQPVCRSQAAGSPCKQNVILTGCQVVGGLDRGARGVFNRSSVWTANGNQLSSARACSSCPHDALQLATLGAAG